MFKIFNNLFDSNEKQLGKLQEVVDDINNWEKDIKKMSSKEIKVRMAELQKELKSFSGKVPDDEKVSINVLQDRFDRSEPEQKLTDRLFEVLPEVFAMARETASRKFDRRHFDVQLMSGVVLAQGKISEMKTGEGKTQVAWLPLTLFGLTGRGAHLVTVNDYLAKLHGEYAGHFFNEIGLSVGVIISQQAYKFIPDDMIAKLKGEEEEKERKKAHIQNPGDVGGWNLVECTKQEAYECDIVYGTNNEFGFDYLRDNMTSDVKRIVQRELYFCIVDEVDSILIDEARTPLIISAPAEKSNDLYIEFARLIPRLKAEDDYTVDEKTRSAVLTDEGIEKIERWLGVKNLWEDYSLAHHLENALKAYTLFKRDDHYLVKDGQVMIVDEFTGRTLPGRRYSEGLHQAIEAKEGVEIKQESKTLATITFQNFFRIYKHLAGMTGTAETEAEEFYKIYQLEVIVVPTNKPVIREDAVDRVYKNQVAKFNAVVQEIKEYHEEGRPILVGTTSVEKSEYLSKQLMKIGIQHEVLNAKHHERESKIVAQAGRKGAVTIATNMAGRGTDIKLGGDPFDKKRFDEVVRLGGLHVIGTERHESRRIDNQLRGRSGRQGEPGSSRFFVALDDEIMRLQGGMMVQSLMERTKVPDDMPIESKIITRSIENAQKRVEGHNFDTRKHLVEYDDVMNQQREIFYRLRRKKLRQLHKAFNDDGSVNDEGLIKSLEEEMKDKLLDEIDQIVNKHFLPERDDAVDIEKTVGDFLDLSSDELIVKAIKHNDKDAKVSESSLSKYLESEARDIDLEKLKDYLEKVTAGVWEIKKTESGMESDEFIEVSVKVYLQTLDELWSEHLSSMQDLREGIGLRGMAQRDPLVEYKNEAIEHFDRFMSFSDEQYSHRILKVQKIVQPTAPRRIATNESQISAGITSLGKLGQRLSQAKQTSSTPASSTTPTQTQKPASKRKIGRNDPCWCGSGKKYKKCHGR